jgi:hypothetical protein|tara:strand:- start:217 stop:378 length:162 start_codon:yes stop_codon:yes gene_type:complete
MGAVMKSKQLPNVTYAARGGGSGQGGYAMGQGDADAEKCRFETHVSPEITAST